MHRRCEVKRIGLARMIHDARCVWPAGSIWSTGLMGKPDKRDRAKARGTRVVLGSPPSTGDVSDEVRNDQHIRLTSHVCFPRIRRDRELRRPPNHTLCSWEAGSGVHGNRANGETKTRPAGSGHDSSRFSGFTWKSF